MIPQSSPYTGGMPCLENRMAAELNEAIDTLSGMIKDRGEVMRKFKTGATRDDDTGKLDYEGFLSPTVLRRYANYMHEHREQADGETRSSDNWKKGIKIEAYMDSMWRHFMDVWMAYSIMKWTTGKNDASMFTLQDQLCALLFNVMGMLHEVIEDREETKVG